MNILLNGAKGGMGSEVIKYLKNTDDKIICGFDTKRESGQFEIYNDISDINEKVDVIIDFSVPKASLEILKYAKKTNTPVVIATTGFDEKQMKIIEEYSKIIPIFKSSNMSLDIKLMTKIVKEISKVLKQADIEIVETHHNRKIDSPSGTALLLANAINETFENQKTYTFDRMQKRQRREKREIGFSSIRGGNIKGEHTVIFFGENESLEVTHKAYSREVFVEGALKAAHFLINKKPGLYNMDDLIKW